MLRRVSSCCMRWFRKSVSSPFRTVNGAPAPGCLRLNEYQTIPRCVGAAMPGGARRDDDCQTRCRSTSDPSLSEARPVVARTTQRPWSSSADVANSTRASSSLSVCISFLRGRGDVVGLGRIAINEAHRSAFFLELLSTARVWTMLRLERPPVGIRRLYCSRRSLTEAPLADERRETGNVEIIGLVGSRPNAALHQFQPGLKVLVQRSGWLSLCCVVWQGTHGGGRASPAGAVGGTADPEGVVGGPREEFGGEDSVLLELREQAAALKARLQELANGLGIRRWLGEPSEALMQEYRRWVKEAFEQLGLTGHF